MEIDHVVLAAPDLDRAKADFAAATGVVPIDGGPHPGRGTRNALVAFANHCYLEIIAPDPQQELAGTNGAQFAALPAQQLLHWAVRSNDLPAVARAASAAGFVPGSIFDMARDTPEGARLQWQLMGIGGYTPGGCMPFFIDWQNTPNPSASAPQVGVLNSMCVGANAALGDLLEPLAGVSLSSPEHGLEISFDSPAGEQRLHAEEPAGFGF